MSEFIISVKEKLDELRWLDTSYSVFGSSTHKYRFNRVAEYKQIETFQQKYDCSLPNPYKDFLLEVGNGGAGPGYGCWMAWM